MHECHKNVLGWTWEADSEGDITYSSSSVTAVLGYGPQEIIGVNLLSLAVPEDSQVLQETLQEISEKLTGVGGLRIRFVAEGGVSKVLSITCVPKVNDEGGFAGFRGVGRDVVHSMVSNERENHLAADECSEFNQRAVELARRSDELEAILHAFPDLYFWLDPDGTIVSYHALDSRELYVPPEQFLRRRMDEVLPPDAALEFQRCIENVKTTHLQAELEYVLPIEGKERYFEARIVPLYNHKILAIVRDITARAEAQNELKRVNRALRVLTNCNQVLVRAASEQELLDSICRVIVETGEHAMAWVSFTQAGEDKLVRAVSFAGRNEGYLESARMTWGDDIYGRGPTGTAIRTVRTAFSVDIETDPNYEAWRDEALRRGFRCTISLPLISDLTTFGALTIISSVPNAFAESEIKLLEELTADLAYGIISLRVREMHSQMEHELRSSETRYRTLVELSPEAIVVHDDEKVLFVNQAAVEMFRASDLLQLNGRYLREFIHPDSLEEARARRSALQKRKGAVPVQEARFIRTDGTVFDGEVTASPIDYQGMPAFLSVIRDVSDRKRAEDREKQLENEKREFYRATIQSVTDGKLDISDWAQMQPYLSEADVVIDVMSASDVASARHATEDYCIEHGLCGERLSSFMIAVGEALTNAIKHGGRGWMYVGTEEGSIYTAVRDEGPGIKSLILPRAVLLRGFSTKPSMGLGYSIMLDASDSILLETSHKGTTVILFKEIQEPVLKINMNALPDTWNSIPE